MANPFIGQITLFPYNFAPFGWALCEGQLLPISQNAALFSLLGVQFGGNGTSNFALPDLRGRVPMGQGQGPGLSPYSVGSQQGVEAGHADHGDDSPPFARLSGFRHDRDDQCAGGALPAEGKTAGEARRPSTPIPLLEPRLASRPARLFR